MQRFQFLSWFSISIAMFNLFIAILKEVNYKIDLLIQT